MKAGTGTTRLTPERTGPRFHVPFSNGHEFLRSESLT